MPWTSKSTPNGAPGELVGDPPTLEWIAVDTLEVDASYQRTTETSRSRQIIGGMVRRWNWSLCQPLAVVRREDRRMMIIDGQHRWAGARARGDIPHLPCVVTRQQDRAAEADMFVELNTRRRQLTQGEIFNASLASGNEGAARVQQLVSDAGLTFARSNVTDRWKPGEIFCGPMLVNALRVHGEPVIRNALTALAEAHAGQVLTSAATLLKSLFLIYSVDAKRPGFDPDLFIAGLAEVKHREWIDEIGRVHREQPALSRVEALATAMIETMDAMRD